MKAYIFPGQGSQFSGMGKDLYDTSTSSKELFENANDILGFKISDIMFGGSDEELRMTNVTQPAIFIHSVILYKSKEASAPDVVAGHSLGEFSALVANGSLSFEDGLRLVSIRAEAMQKACDAAPGSMAAILGLHDDKVIEVCASIDEVVIAANFNCPGQVVISGTTKGVNEACEKLKEAGAKRALVLAVGGAFHSPLMEPARVDLEKAIIDIKFNQPQCSIYQNVNAMSSSDVETIKSNLIDQLTSPVLWTQSVQNMISDGINSFTECGPGKVLQGLVNKINKEVKTESI